MVNYTKPETRKWMCDSKENRSTVISKDDYGNTVLSVIVVHLAYGSHFCKRPQLLRHNIVLLHANARRHTANWTFMAVHLIGHGSVPNLHSVFYLSLNLEKHLAGK